MTAPTPPRILNASGVKIVESTSSNLRRRGGSVKPIDYVTGPEHERAIRSLREYASNYTGRHFETFARLSPADQITANEIVAVAMLSVRVPARTAIALILDRADEVAELLDERHVPRGIELWDPALDITNGGQLWRLWDLIKACGLGGKVVRSKLLAAKRPHAVPIYDQYVASALEVGTDDYWAYWRAQLQGAGGDALRSAASDIRSAVVGQSELSILRVLDIVIWMRQHGFRDASDWQERFSDFTAPVHGNE